MQITKYQCDKCGALYDTEEDCGKCAHLIPVALRGFSYTEGLIFPEYIKVGFEHKGTDMYQTYRLDMLANASKKGIYHECSN